MITPAQCRAARGLLKWTQADLARAARISKDTVRDFELENKTPHEATITVIKLAFEAHSVEFTNGDAHGVRLPKSNQSS